MSGLRVSGVRDLTTRDARLPKGRVRNDPISPRHLANGWVCDTRGKTNAHVGRLNGTGCCKTRHLSPPSSTRREANSTARRKDPYFPRSPSRSLPMESALRPETPAPSPHNTAEQARTHTHTHTAITFNQYGLLTDYYRRGLHATIY
jgi:hypothetical protein